MVEEACAYGELMIDTILVGFVFARLLFDSGVSHYFNIDFSNVIWDC